MLIFSKCLIFVWKSKKKYLFRYRYRYIINKIAWINEFVCSGGFPLYLKILHSQWYCKAPGSLWEIPDSNPKSYLWSMCNCVNTTSGGNLKFDLLTADLKSIQGSKSQSYIHCPKRNFKAWNISWLAWFIFVMGLEIVRDHIFLIGLVYFRDLLRNILWI